MGKRKLWSKEAMIEAVKAVREKKMGYKLASKTFQVPRATLKDYVKSDLSAEAVVEKTVGRPPILTDRIEKLLVQYCLDMDNSFYGLSVADLRRLAYQLAIKNNLPHPFSMETKQAGLKWKRLFLNRHPELSLRKPQNLSLARIQGFNRENVQIFFSILKSALEKVRFDETRIYNVDETGVSVVQHKASRVITMKGKKQVHKIHRLNEVQL